jgi:trimeric autotransporter adhesin
VSGTRSFHPARWGRRRVIAAVAILAIVAILATVFLTRPAAANEQYGLQTINVGMDTNTTITSVRTASVTKDADDHVTETVVDIDPTDAVADLPVRVQTSWWHDGGAGTDLSALTGKSGRFVVQVSVQDLTAEATELSFETDGAHYRQQALVGVPLTVVASASVGSGDRVVQVADGADDTRVTNGVLAETTDTGRAVQWAAFLAPPMLSPTADFTLVIDTQDFQAPDFDITVQPGLVTDPSVSALVDRAFGADGYSAQLESSTISLVQNVNGRLTEALQFVDEVHATLEQDVSQLGEQTYGDLESSAQTVLDHLESTAADLESILGSTQSGIQQVGTQTRSGIEAVSRSMTAILGNTRSAPAMTPTAIAGCSVTMPTLAEGEDHTVAATVFVADAQLRAITDLFASGDRASADNCRTALQEMVRATIGDPSTLDDPGAMAACVATPADQRTVACTLAVARGALEDDLSELAATSTQVRESYDQLPVQGLNSVLSGTDGLAATLSSLRDRLVAASGDASSVSSDLAAWAQETAALVNDARDATQSARVQVEDARTAVATLRASRDELYAGLFGGSDAVAGRLDAITAANTGTPSVGAWFVDSEYAAGLTALVTSVDDCAADWATGLSATSSAEEIVAALAQLDVAGCPARDLAVASQDMVTGYALTVDTITAMDADADAATVTLTGLRTSFDTLDAAIGDVESLTADGAALSAALTALSDPDGTSGTLVELAARVQTLADSASAGDMSALDTELAGLVTVVQGIWPDDSVQPLTGTDTCSEDATQPPTAAGQSVIWLSNRLLCVQHTLGGRLTILDNQIDTTTRSTDSQLALTATQTQSALDRAQAQIDLMSGELASNLDQQRAAAAEGSLAMIAASQAQMTQELDAILASYDLTSSQVLQQLTDSMQRSASQSTQVAATLDEAFTNLLANLGSPDPTSRGGMLGKLHSITTQVGETGTVLDAVGTTTTAYGNVRSGELRDIDLRAAQFDAAEARRAGYRPFTQVDDDLETVFVVQLRGEN